jgi:hypothetical protein
MIFLFEAVPESIVRRYFLQVPALLNLRFPGSRMPVGSTDLIAYLYTMTYVDTFYILAARAARARACMQIHILYFTP